MNNQKKSDSEYSLKWSKKIRAIKVLGGHCNKCGNKNVFQLEFHHMDDDKLINVGVLLHGRWSNVEKEVKKCILLCRNCHSELHCDKENILKEKLMEIKGQKQCMECGYDKQCSALDFHHSDEKDKEFRISRGYRDDRWKIPLDDIIVEMDKCNILCKNCHALKHVDIKKFENLKNTIYSKIDNYTELQKPADREMVKKLIAEGYGVCSIANKMGYSKSTISLIKKNMGL